MTPAGERGGFSTLGLLVSGCCLRTPETPFPGSGFQGLGSLRFSHLPLKAQQQMGTIFYHVHLPELLKWLNLSASVEKKKKKIESLGNSCRLIARKLRKGCRGLGLGGGW